MAEKKLDLFQFSTIHVTELRTCAPEIMRREVVHLHSLGAPSE
jgi:hypothetical protein